METRKQETERRAGSPPGIVIRQGPIEPRHPRVVAFVWGGKVRPLPTLPYGRWKAGATAA